MQTPAQKDTLRATHRDERSGKVHWWLRLTSAGWDRPQETIEQRERARRSRLLAWVLLGLFIALIVFIPATFKDTPTVFSVCIALLGLVFIAFCNRQGWITLAGILLVILNIGATLGVVVGAPGGDIRLIYLPAYDFLVVPVILGATILPRFSAFVIAAINIALIYSDLILQPKALDMQQAIQQYGLPVLAGRPSAILVITAMLAYLWARGMDQAARRADQAEEIRALEQYLNQVETEHAARVKEFVQEVITAISALSNGQEGLLLLPPDHPWQHQATFINTQLRQFYKLKQSYRSNNEQLALATESLLRALMLLNSGQVPISALDPRRFTTRLAVTDEIVKQIYILLHSRPVPGKRVDYTLGGPSEAGS